MLAEYLHQAKEVVQAKQARPGVAVHVRLGGGNSGGDQADGGGDAMDTANSYAVWAVTAGRDACGVVRVACSEMAQTEVPRSAVQRVQVRAEWMHDCMRYSLDHATSTLDLTDCLCWTQHFSRGVIFFVLSILIGSKMP